MSDKTIAAPKLKENKNNVGAFFRKYTMIIALVVVTLVFNFWKEREGLILMPSNLTGLIAENGYVFVLAAGMLMCILTGGNIDLSVGSVVCFTAAIGCNLMVSDWPWWAAVLVMLAIGAAIGAFQGFWIARLKVPAFIATLAGMYAFRGLTNVVLDGMRVDVTNQTFLDLFGNGKTSYLEDFVRGWIPNVDKFLIKFGTFITKLRTAILKVFEFFAQLIEVIVQRFTRHNTLLLSLKDGGNTVNKALLIISILFAVGAAAYIALSVIKILKQKKQGNERSVCKQILKVVVLPLLIAKVILFLAENIIIAILRMSKGYTIQYNIAKLVSNTYKPAKFNVTCLAIFLLAAIAFVIIRVFSIIKQKRLGIAKNVPGQIISTVIIAILLAWVGLKFGCYRGFPLVLIWIALILGICSYVTNKMRIGRHLYAIGGNEKAAALSGVKTGNVYWFAYAIIGMMAGLAGVLTAARARGIDPVYGEGYEMDAIAACFIGGASAYGGSGKISGMIIGALLMGVINKGMIIVGVDANYQKVVKGIVLLLAVLFDVLSKRKKK